MKTYTAYFLTMCWAVLSTVVVHAQTYQYDKAGRLTDVSYADGSSISYTYDANGNITRISSVAASVPNGDGVVAGTMLAGLHATPNPTIGATTISYSLARTADVEIIITSALGDIIATYSPGEEAPGDHAFSWDGTTDNGDVPASGVYLLTVRLRDRDGREEQSIEKIILVQSKGR